MKRKDGWYWVKLGENWMVGKWDSDKQFWYIPEYGGGKVDSAFTEIYEILITR